MCQPEKVVNLFCDQFTTTENQTRTTTQDGWTLIAVPCTPQFSYLYYIYPTFSNTLIFWFCKLQYQMPVMQRSRGLRRIPLRTIKRMAWLWKLIPCGYLSPIKKVYSEFCYWNNPSLVLPDVIKKAGNSILLNLAQFSFYRVVKCDTHSWCCFCFVF